MKDTSLKSITSLLLWILTYLTTVASISRCATTDIGSGTRTSISTSRRTNSCKNGGKWRCISGNIKRYIILNHVKETSLKSITLLLLWKLTCLTTVASISRCTTTDIWSSTSTSMSTNRRTNRCKNGVEMKMYIGKYLAVYDFKSRWKKLHWNQ